ncbi:hypothetical protein VTN02DRAFT_1190 [Thermoascus thermophilus]
MSPGSPLSASFNPSYASDEKESTYLSRIRMINWIRLGLAFVILGAAAAIVGCEAVPLHHYRSTSSFGQYWLYLWPLNFDLRPTNALLSCGAVIVFQALVYIIATLLPSPHPRTRLLNILSTAVSCGGFIAAVTGIAFAIYLPSSTYPSGFTENETLHSWTCRWKSMRGLNILDEDGTPLRAPDHFPRDCVETRAGFILLGLLIGLEVMMGAAAAAGWWVEIDVRRRRQAEKVKLGRVEVSAKGP